MGRRRLKTVACKVIYCRCSVVRSDFGVPPRIFGIWWLNGKCVPIHIQRLYPLYPSKHGLNESACPHCSQRKRYATVRQCRVSLLGCNPMTRAPWKRYGVAKAFGRVQRPMSHHVAFCRCNQSVSRCNWVAIANPYVHAWVTCAYVTKSVAFSIV